MADETDISGRTIPARTRTNAGVARTIAVPPVRDVPNENATELLWSGYSSLAAGGAAYVQLTDPQSGAAFSRTLNSRNRGRLSSMLVYCPDMVTAAAPYLFLQLQIIGQPANAWSFVPVYPRTGVASLTFPMATDLPPGANLKLFAENTDAANTHFFAVYLYGWYWPKDLVQG